MLLFLVFNLLGMAVIYFEDRKIISHRLAWLLMWINVIIGGPFAWLMILTIECKDDMVWYRSEQTLWKAPRDDHKK